MVVTKNKIKDLLATFSKIRILVVGDIILDEFHWCNVNRISPEAPVPICSVNSTTLAPGGAANVAANLTALNATVDICGFIGHDSSGDKLLRTLKEQKICIKGLVKTSRPTSLKSRIIAGHQHVVRVDREQTHVYSRKYYDQLYTFIDSNIQQYQAIVLSDYLKGVLSTSFTKKIITLAKQYNCMIIVDPKGTNFTKYKHSDYITPNFKEFCDVTKKTYASEKSIFLSGKKLVKQLHLKSLILTRSEQGISIIREGEFVNLPTKAKEVFDITGAGDTVIALLTLGLSAGLTLIHSIKLANIAAGIVVGKVGTAFPTIEEISTELQYETSF